MRISLLCLVVLAASGISLPVAVRSQEVVHALTGTVSSINSAAKSITVFQDNGTKGVFQQLSGGRVRYAFDKNLAKGAIESASFNSRGAYAIVFYYGLLEDPTVVALKGLGKGPFDSAEGTITSFSSRDRSLTITDKSGASRTFKLTSDSVAEGDDGAIEALKLQAHKGDHVRIVSAVRNGAPTAVFVKDM